LCVSFLAPLFIFSVANIEQIGIALLCNILAFVTRLDDEERISSVYQALGNLGVSGGLFGTGLFVCIVWPSPEDYLVCDDCPDVSANDITLGLVAGSFEIIAA
jgi:hypothetical protein